MLMVGSVAMLRRKAPAAERPYRTFAYPLPMLFYLVVAGLLVVGFRLPGAEDRRDRLRHRPGRHPGLLAPVDPGAGKRKAAAAD